MSHSDIKTGKVKDKEGYMAHSQMGTMKNAIGRLKKNIKKKDQQIPAWVQSKITKASDYVDTAADYMDSNESFKMPSAIDPKAHKKGQKDRKIRNMTQSPNENEAAVAKRKAKGPEWKRPVLEGEEERYEPKEKYVRGSAFPKEKYKMERSYKEKYTKKTTKESLSLVDQILSEIDLNEDLSIQDARGNEMYQVVDLIKPEPIINEKHNGRKCDKCDGEGCKHCDGKGYHEIEEASIIKKGHCCNEEDDEDMGEKKYCKKCKKKEYRSECKYGGKVWDKMTSDNEDESEDSDDVSEAVRIKAKTGNLVSTLITWRGKSLLVKMFFPTLKYPSRSEVEDEVKKLYPGARVLTHRRIEYTPGEPFIHVNEEVSEGMHRDAETGEVVDKAVIGRTYYPNMPKKKTSVALRKEKEKAKVDEKIDLTKQSSKRKSLGRGSSIKDGSKKTGYESPKEFRDAEKKFSTEAKNVHGEIENPSGNLKKLVSKAVKRVDTDVDGDVEHNDQHKGEYGEFLPTPFGKFKTGGAKPSSKRSKK